MSQNSWSNKFMRQFCSMFIASCLASVIVTQSMEPSAGQNNDTNVSDTGIESGQIVVVVLDDSGSMKDQMRTANGRIRRMDAAKQALELVVDRLPEDTQLGVLLLNGSRRRSKWLKDLGPLKREKTKSQIRSVNARGGTPLGQSMKQGIERLLEVRSQEVYGTYRLLVITDGEATDGGKTERLLPDILSRGVLVDVIGVDMAKAHSLANRAHSYREADDLASFKEAVTAVFAESVSDDSVDGENDFDVLNAIPDDVAEAVLQQLTNPRNEEIKESLEGDFSSDPPGGGSADVALGLMCCSSPVVVIILMVAVFVIIVLNKQRR